MNLSYGITTYRIKGPRRWPTTLARGLGYITFGGLAVGVAAFLLTLTVIALGLYALVKVLDRG